MCEKGKKFGRLNKIQSRLVALAFAIPALSENFDEPEKPHELSLPLNFVCRDRGKVIMRSDWTEDAMWLTLDARPDAFLIGHDVCSRGVFVLNADGRAWGFCPEWKWYTESCDYSLPRIDGVGQMHKAPFVKLLDVTDGECGSTYASTDLTYAYNWTWTTWAKEGQNFRKQGYEPEPSDPRDFGYNVWWAPTKLYGERNVAFVGLHQWRKRFATVEKVTRSAMLVRAARPFTIVADNVKKDDEEHEYAWAMSTPDDVQLVSFDGTDAILTETEGSGRRFLIRSLCLDNVELQCSFHALEKLGETANRDDKARQIVLRCHANGVKFIFLMFSLPTAEFKAPETAWIEEGKLLEIHDQQTQETQRIEFGESESGAIEMKVLPVAQEPRSVNVII